jgi:hypothetical protein
MDGYFGSAAPHFQNHNRGSAIIGCYLCGDSFSVGFFSIMEDITQDLLRQFFSYREDGNLIVIKKRLYSDKIGCPAGYIKKKDGYRYICLFGKKRLAHRLVFMYHKGFVPKEIDHINRIKSDNRIENLRASTRSQNMANKTKKSGFLSKYKGVTISSDGKYQVTVKREYIGVFENEIDAAKAYDKVAKELFGEFAYLNFKN